jgi:hypothetical protein
MARTSRLPSLNDILGHSGSRVTIVTTSRTEKMRLFIIRHRENVTQNPPVLADFGISGNCWSLLKVAATRGGRESLVRSAV